jgi:biuret amidohydrolase
VVHRSNHVRSANISQIQMESKAERGQCVASTSKQTAMERNHMDPILENRLSQTGSIDPERVAVLGIHWQNDLISSDGAFGRSFATEVSRTNVLVNASRFISSARTFGAKIIFINVAYDANFPGLVGNNALFASVIKDRSFLKGASGTKIAAEFQLHPSDVVLEHSRISAFFGTDLLSVLLGMRITTIALTGIATNVAVDHTARDAAQYGFNTHFIEDCCCASNKDYQAAALLTMKVLCTEVQTSTSFLSRLNENSRSNPKL